MDAREVLWTLLSRDLELPPGYRIELLRHQVVVNWRQRFRTARAQVGALDESLVHHGPFSGEQVPLDGDIVTLARAVATGHKVAARPIAEGELVIKYGCPIGVATRAIAAGEPVHTHNMKSDYRSPLILGR